MIFKYELLEFNQNNQKRQSIYQRKPIIHKRGPNKEQHKKHAKIYDRQTRPGLVAFYDIWPGNGAGLFLQPRTSTGLSNPTQKSEQNILYWGCKVNTRNRLMQKITQSQDEQQHSLTVLPQHAWQVSYQRSPKAPFSEDLWRPGLNLSDLLKNIPVKNRM